MKMYDRLQSLKIKVAKSHVDIKDVIPSIIRGAMLQITKFKMKTISNIIQKIIINLLSFIEKLYCNKG